MSFETGLKIAAIVIPLLFTGILVLMKVAGAERQAILNKLDDMASMAAEYGRTIAVHTEWIRQHDIWWDEYKKRIDQRLTHLEHPDPWDGRDRRRSPRRGPALRGE